MAINQNDDYEKLAKLLYPSIEASGNVYYGQTRKLSLYELFNKDDLWFDAHIESDRPTVKIPTVLGSSDPYDSDYTVYFYWNLAGMNDCIQIRSMLDKRYGPTFDTELYSKIVFEDYKGEERVIRDYDSDIDDEAGIFTGTAFIKYKLNISDTVINNEVNSGNFTSYEKSITLGNKSVYITELPELHQQEIGSTPETNNSVDKRNFYIFEESDGMYLYVKVCTGIIGNGNRYIGELDNSDYLSIKAINGNINFNISRNLSTAKYAYSYDGLSWFNFSSLEPYLLRKNESILVKCTYKEKYAVPQIHGPSDSSDNIEYVDPSTPDYHEYDGSDFDSYLKHTTFEFTKVDEDSNASIEISGNMLSLCPEPDQADQYQALFANLFKDCTLITKANIFFKNIELLDSQSQYAYWYWFYNTFSECTSLQRCETLPAIDINAVNRSYERMFYLSNSLNRIKLADGWVSTGGTSDWLYCQGDGVIDGNNNDFSSTGLARNSYDGIPRNWYYDSIYVPLNIYCTNGTVYVRLTDGSNDGSRRSFRYSIDGANFIFWDQAVQMSIPEGSRLYFKRSDYNDNVNTTTQYTHLDITYSNGSGNSDRAELYGNIRSIVQTEDFYQQDSSKNYEYYGLFKDDGPITKAPKIPDASLSGQHACHMTFSGCTNLVEAPEIHAETLGSNCCQTMFQNCTSLVEAPELPALTLAQSCYQSMFNGCTSLRKAPKLLATAAKQSCYQGMFFNCHNLRSLHCDTSTDSLNPGFSSWLSGTSEAAVDLDDDTGIYVSLPAILYTSNKDTAFWKGIAFLSSKIPKNWYLDNYQKLSGNKFNDDSDKKPGIIVSSGANSIENGRGVLINNTVYNMLKKNPFTNKPRTLDGVAGNNTVRHSITINDQLVSTDTYDYVGSYNQEVWGYKSFNSPVAFRNGVYGETGAIIATKDSNDNDITEFGLYTAANNSIRPTIQLRNDTDTAKSIVNITADEVTINGESIGSGTGIIPYIPTQLSPEDSFTEGVGSPEVGDLMQLVVRAAPVTTTTGDTAFVLPIANNGWQYLGFPVASNSEYRIFRSEHNASQTTSNSDAMVNGPCTYARYRRGISPDFAAVEYSDDEDYRSGNPNWALFENLQPVTETFRYGEWEYVGDITMYYAGSPEDEDPPTETYSVYENEWSTNDSSYSNMRFYSPTADYSSYGSSGYEPCSVSMSTSDFMTQFEGAMAGTYFDDPRIYYNGNADSGSFPYNESWAWDEVTPQSGAYHHVYYNANNQTYQLYNADTERYLPRTSLSANTVSNITNASAGSSSPGSGDSAFAIGPHMQWIPVGIFYNSSNSLSNNQYFRNYNTFIDHPIYGIDVYTNGSSSFYGSSSDYAALTHSFIDNSSSVVTWPSYNIHYGALLFKSDNVWYLQDLNHPVEVYRLTYNQTQPVIVNTTEFSNSCRIAVLSHAVTIVTLQLDANEDHVFFAQRIQ